MRSRVVSLLVIGLILGVAGPGVAEAKYARVDTEEVPVERAIANCERLVKASPADRYVRLALARVLAMAFARRGDPCTVEKGKGGGTPWFGYTPDAIPFEAKPAGDDEAVEKLARGYLDRAIEVYAALVKELPDFHVARLGHAWCLEQRGDREAAVAAYRALIADAHAAESKGRPMGKAVTAEAVGYLVPLLDPKKDAAEIAALTAKKAEIEALPRKVTPIAIPLVDGLAPSELVEPRARVAFDLDGSGEKKTWRWLRADAGWLVWDPRRRGEIRSGLQMFGNVTFWMFWRDGYQALASLDDDGDGWIRGEEAAGLAIWRDLDVDGVSDPGEVAPLAAWGIVGLRCAATGEVDGMPVSEDGVLLRDGRSRASVDVILEALRPEPARRTP